MVIGFDEVPAPATAQAAPSVPPAAGTGRGRLAVERPGLAAEQTSGPSRRPTSFQGADREGHGSAHPLRVAGRRALVAFYLMVLGPKREEASKLSDEVEQLEASVAQQERVVEFAEAAKQDFPRYYGRLAVLGKAVPEAADSASLLVQLSRISSNADVEFRGLQLAEDRPRRAPPPDRDRADGGPRRQPSATDVPRAVEAAALDLGAGSTASSGSTATARSTTASAPRPPRPRPSPPRCRSGRRWGPQVWGRFPMSSLSGASSSRSPTSSPASTAWSTCAMAGTSPPTGGC